VPMAENMSAYLATCSVFFFVVTVGVIFLYLQKHGGRVKRIERSWGWGELEIRATPISLALPT